MIDSSECLRPDDFFSEEYRTAFLNPPLSVKVPAFLFIAFGITGLINMLLGFGLGSIRIDFSFLGIFIGRGLLRYRNGWRQTAVVFTVLPLMVLGLGLVLFPLMAFSGLSSWSLTPSPVAFAILGPAIVAYLVWQSRVLTSAWYIELCYLASVENSEAVRQIIASRGRRLSLSSLLLIVMVAAIVTASVVNQDWYSGGSGSTTLETTSGNRHVRVSYSWSQHRFWSQLEKFDYIVFEHGSTSSIGRHFLSRGWAIRVKEELVPIPIGSQLCEIQDGKVRFARADVRREELEAFIRQMPADKYTIDELIDFVEQRRKQRR
jgi:hypothetical protein